jgi:hypothetical protein
VGFFKQIGRRFAAVVSDGAGGGESIGVRRCNKKLPAVGVTEQAGGIIILKEGVQQDFIKKIGDEGCYALCLCKVKELHNPYGAITPGESVYCIELGIKKGYIKEDMTVLDGAGFLYYSSGSRCRWTKEYKPADYKPVDGDYLIAEWFNKRTGLTHFTLEYPEKWNSLMDSVTVKEGAIRSYRLYRAQGT